MILETSNGAIASVARPSDRWAAYTSLAEDTFSGSSVTPEGALALSAVYGAVSLIAQACGTMPLEVIDEMATGSRRKVTGAQLALMLRHRPNQDMSGPVLWSLVFAHLALRGNAYLVKLRDSSGVVRELYPLNPTYVHPFRGDGGRKLFRVSLYTGDTNVDVVLDSSDVLHIMGQSFDNGLMGASPIAVMRNMVGRQLAQSEHTARFYQDGMSMQGAIVTPERLNAETVRGIKSQWRQDHAGLENAWGVSVLHSGATFQAVSLSPEDAQFIQTMKWGHTEVATAYNIPASRLNGEGASLTYANQGQDDLFLYKQAFHPRLVMVEAALNMDEDLFGYTSRWVPRFNADAALRADIETRYKVYQSGRNMGVLSVNDVRTAEDLPAVAGGDEYSTPQPSTTTGM